MPISLNLLTLSRDLLHGPSWGLSCVLWTHTYILPTLGGVSVSRSIWSDGKFKSSVTLLSFYLDDAFMAESVVWKSPTFSLSFIIEQTFITSEELVFIENLAEAGH